MSYDAMNPEISNQMPQTGIHNNHYRKLDVERSSKELNESAQPKAVLAPDQGSRNKNLKSFVIGHLPLILTIAACLILLTPKRWLAIKVAEFHVDRLEKQSRIGRGVNITPFDFRCILLVQAERQKARR